MHFYTVEPMSAARLLLAGGIPFLFVSIARRVINAPRPYEIYDFYTVLPKKKSGRSFPSRHVFSAFAVATFMYTTSFWLFFILLILGMILAVARVLLGMHFIRDVAAGTLVGVLSAILGIIIFF